MPTLPDVTGSQSKSTHATIRSRSYPGLERIDTWNAGSNEPMLNINVAMGFEPILVTMAWQGDLPEARRHLGV